MVVTPEDPESMIEAILKLYRMSDEDREKMGRKARNYYEKNLSMDTGVLKFEKLFYQLAQN